VRLLEAKALQGEVGACFVRALSSASNAPFATRRRSAGGAVFSGRTGNRGAAIPVKGAASQLRMGAHFVVIERITGEVPDVTDEKWNFLWRGMKAPDELALVGGLGVG
jgi:hypothetical protein